MSVLGIHIKYSLYYSVRSSNIRRVCTIIKVLNYSRIKFVYEKCIVSVHLLLLSDMYKYLLRPNSSKFGMPSGHCQVYYAFMTYKLVHPLQNLNIVETMLMLWFGMFLCFQRVADNKHTWGQVIFGSIIGALSGYFIARH